MSTITTVLNSGQAAQFDRSVTKIFLGKNTYDFANYTNSTGSTLVVPAGTLVGRINASPTTVALMTSAAVDGSQFPCGITREDHTVTNGQTVKIFFCTSGDVAEELIVFQGSDAFTTIVSGRIYRDRIAADTVGVKIVRTADENTDVDNALV